MAETKEKKVDPIVEAAKIEHIIYISVCVIEDATAAVHKVHLLAKLRKTQTIWSDIIAKKELEDKIKLAKEAEIRNIETYGLLAALVLDLIEILKSFGDAFKSEDRTDLEHISIVIAEVAKNLGKQSKLPWVKSISDSELIEFGNLALRELIEQKKQAPPPNGKPQPVVAF